MFCTISCRRRHGFFYASLTDVSYLKWVSWLNVHVSIGCAKTWLAIPFVSRVLSPLNIFSHSHGCFFIWKRKCFDIRILRAHIFVFFVHFASVDRLLQPNIDSSFPMRMYCALRTFSCCSEAAEFMLLKLFSGVPRHAVMLQLFFGTAACLTVLIQLMRSVAVSL